MSDEASPPPFEGEVFGEEVNAFFLAPYYDDAIARLGEDVIREKLRAVFGVELDQLRDRNAWVTLSFIEELLPMLKPPGDPTFFNRMGRNALTSKYLGFLRPLIRAVGSVKMGYASFGDTLQRFNKIGEGSMLRSDATTMTAEYKSLPGAPTEKNRDVCDGRRGQLEALPTLFDVPPARVEHPSCMHEGAPSCIYEITFKERRPRTRLFVAALLGTVAGGLAGLAIGWPWWACALGGLLFAWGVERRNGLRAALSDQTTAIGEQHDALLQSAAANEARFAELLEAKSAVEQRVEERTQELQHTTNQLAETLEQVQNLSQARTDFFSNMSHELRTPLTLLMAPLTHLVRGEDPPGGTKPALEAMERNADRLLRMINQLLDLARVESGSATLERAPVSPTGLLNASRAAFLAAARAKGVSIDVEAKELPLLSLDAAWLETAMTNLVANALKFTRNGDRIVLGVVDQGDEIVFSVEDTGVGIPADKLESLFERFRRGSGPGAGSGIGLSLVHEAARLHGGSAEVSSELGKGSTFRLRLPRVVTSGHAAVHQMPAAAVVSDECPSSPGPDAAAPLALVAEDNADVRRFVVDVLAAQYRVVSVRNGLEAVAAMKENRPDILVSDISMPEMDGLELTRLLRGGGPLPDVPVLLVTARGEPAQVLEGFDAGADDYVVKPFHGRELLARAGALVRARRMAGRLVHQERLATVGMVAASVAHHIRNPLNALVGGLPAVRDRLEGSIDAGTERMFEVFIDCAERIELVTTDLLDLSRVDREAHCTFAPGRGLAASVRLMETRFGDAIQIEQDIDEKALVTGRAGDLHHVFLNVLDNAARAMDAKGRLRVGGHQENGSYVVRIDDNGPGIPDGILATVFEHFVTTRPAGEGTGLGLAIAKEIVQSHKGTIRATKSDLGGALLEIRLPIA